MSVASRTIYVHVGVMRDDHTVQFKLMIPSALKARVEEMAAVNRRSLSQEIVVALEEKFPAPPPGHVKSLEARVLLWLAARIRKRRPKPGSARDRQALAYENLAAQAIAHESEVNDNEA